MRVTVRHRPRPSPVFAAVVGAATVPLIVAGCMPAPATTQAEAVSTLWTQFAVAAAIVGGTVWILITFMILRYRNRPSDHDALPSQSRFIPLEIAWTAIPVVIVLVLFVLT